MQIQNKVAIIAGASTGIGLAAACLFSSHGVRVALIARQDLEAENIRVGLVYPGRTIDTQFGPNTIDRPRPRYTAPPGIAGRAYPYDTPEDVAAKILEAVETGAGETYSASTQPLARTIPLIPRFNPAIR